MPSTYTTNGGIEKIAAGEQSGTWGDTTNTNFDIIDRITNGVGSIALSGTSSNLTTSDGTLSDGHYKVLVLGGSPSGTHTITVLPNDAEKLYFVKNDSGQSVIFSQGSGSNVTIADSSGAIIYCDGGGTSAAVVDMTASFGFANSLTDFGVTATSTELNYNDLTTLGVSEASKVVTANGSGVVRFADGITEGFQTVSSSSATTTLNLTQATNFMTTLTEATTVQFSNESVDGTVSACTLKIVQDGSGSQYTVSWESAIRWPNGTAPSLSTGADDVDVFVFFTHDAGANWYGFLAGKNME